VGKLVEKVHGKEILESTMREGFFAAEPASVSSEAAPTDHDYGGFSTANIRVDQPSPKTISTRIYAASYEGKEGEEKQRCPSCRSLHSVLFRFRQKWMSGNLHAGGFGGTGIIGTCPCAEKSNHSWSSE